jgi:hypothetical protein
MKSNPQSHNFYRHFPVREKVCNFPTIAITEIAVAKKAADEIAFEKLEAEVDRLLLKISESGEESLTEVERETLRRASREYQKRQK